MWCSWSYKRAIDGMPSFCVKNTFRKDIIRYDIVFKQGEKVVDVLSIKCPNFNYKYLPREGVVKSRIIQNSTKIILDCMKQYFMVFTPNDLSFVKKVPVLMQLLPSIQVQRIFGGECTTLFWYPLWWWFWKF